jgi:hypothetical protein
LSWLREEGGHPILQASSSVSSLTPMRPAPFWHTAEATLSKSCAKHGYRLENPGKILLELIEVQTGSYLGEIDIIRIEDDYQRP